MSRLFHSSSLAVLLAALSAVVHGPQCRGQTPTSSPPLLQILGPNLKLDVTGQAGTTYGVMASANLQTWQPISVSGDLFGQFETTDPLLPFLNHRFYRAASGVSCPTNSALTQQFLVTSSYIEFYQGSAASFTVQLSLPPTNLVPVAVSIVAGSSQIVVSNSSLLFTPLNWNLPQTVTITATNSGATASQLNACLLVTSDAIPAQAVNVIALPDATDDEFVGPFASWVDAQADFGAVGDGVADDTAALQNALSALRPYTGPPALYLPAGKYRITQSLNVDRSMDSESRDLLIIGEDPETTTIIWNGPTNGVMINYQAWYAKMSRLTLDGAGVARTAIAHGPAFSTHNEFSDMVFTRLGFGIEAGVSNGLGNAETVVERCVFSNCSQAGVSVENFDSLNWFIWDSEFDDCGSGVSNEYGAGNFHVYRSLFRNSTQSDISIANTSYFSIRNNMSIGSQAFFTATAIDSCSPITLEGNTVLSPSGIPIQVGNLGPVILLDNQIQDFQGLAAALEPSGALASVGNTFTATNAVQGTDARISLDDVTTCETLPAMFPRSPRALPNRGRTVIDVPGPTNAATVQAAINQAAALTGQRPVVHLAAGVYTISQTLAIPAGCDVQLTGDGGKTQLRWAGSNAGPVISLAGPVRATLRDFALYAAYNALQADGIRLTNCDQPGSRVFLEQADSSSTAMGLYVQGISNAQVCLEDFYHSQNQTSVVVLGAGQSPSGQVPAGATAIFGGASAENNITYVVTNGAGLLVRDMWYESVNTNQARFMQCTDSGNFTLHGANIALSFSQLAVPTVEVSNFVGNLSFIGTEFLFTNTSLDLSGNGQDTSLLMLGTVNSNDPDFDSPAAQVGLYESFQIVPGAGFELMYGLDTTYPNFPRDFLRSMLAQTRTANPPVLTPLPAGTTDFRLHRVFVQTGGTGIHIQH